MNIFIGMIVNAMLNWLAKYFADHLAAYERDKANQAKAREQAALDNKAAQTINEGSKSDEVDHAIDDSLSHL